MPKIIFTSQYIQNPSKANAGKLVKYMGTREGVEKLPNGVDNKPATKKQKDLIATCITAVPEAWDYSERQYYSAHMTKDAATEFLDAFIERNADRIDGIKKLVSYMGERPGVEKLGKHGLFSQTDDKINLDAVAEEISHHEGILWTHVVSLHREDAERLGYNNAEAWKELVRRNALQIAEAHKTLTVRQGVKEISRRNGTEFTSGREIKVGKPKSATSKRTVPLNRTAIEMIENLRKESYFGENTPLVCDEKGGYTKPVNLRKRFYRILKAAGIEQKVLHSLRHTFATNLVNGQKQPDGTMKALSPRQVADLLGHSTSQITELYYVKKDTARLSGITEGFEM